MKRLPPLNALRTFQVAAQLGSFTRAGEALHVTQGAVSRQIRLLEDTLGRALFFRVHQGIRLTEAESSWRRVCSRPSRPWSRPWTSCSTTRRASR